MNDVALVACSKLKQTAEVPARDLYVSPLFKLARHYAEANAHRWFILSAEHGLLDPERVTAPYDTTLNKMAIAGRRAWAQRVTEQMKQQDVSGVRLLILAGQVYRGGLMPYFWTRFDEIAIPLDGLKIGEQLSWLSKRMT